MTTTAPTKPGWAQHLSDDTWERVDTMLADGWNVPTVMKTLDIAAQHKRSLQVYRKENFKRYRRVRLDTLRDYLSAHPEKQTKRVKRILQVLQDMVENEEVKESVRVKAGDILLAQHNRMIADLAGDEGKSDTVNVNFNPSERMAAALEELKKEFGDG